MTLEPADRHLPRTEAGGLAAPASTETSRVLARRRHLVALPGRAGAGPGAPAGRGPFRDRVVLRSGRVHLGPGVGAADALAAEPVRVRLPLLAAVLARVARPPVRDRETVVGSLCCADPASALTAAAVALDARFTVSRPDGGTEELAATDFFADPHRVALPPGAAVVDVSFPVAPPGTVAGLHQLKRTPCDAAHVAAAAQLTVAGGTVTDARVAVVGAGARPVRMTAVEAALTGRPLVGDALRAAARLAGPRRGRELTVVVARALRAAAGLTPAW